ncbi:rab-GTPase-TBC domain-containing protein [Peziza echinospora]|nr:rab-GTPase-TBC domain-containing protein [Peziza echinospora]
MESQTQAVAGLGIPPREADTHAFEEQAAGLSDSITTSMLGSYVAPSVVESFESSDIQDSPPAAATPEQITREQSPGEASLGPVSRSTTAFSGSESQAHTTLQSPLIQSLVSPTSSRPALFDDHVASAYVPGSLHLAPDSTIERLVERLGVVPFIRQLAGDLAHRDRELVTFRLKAEERERALKKMLVEVEVANVDIERRLAACQKYTATEGSSEDSGSFTECINDMMQQALDEEDAFSVLDSRPTSNSNEDESEDYHNLITPKATLRSHGNSMARDSDSIQSFSSQKSSGIRGWKDYFWGQKTNMGDHKQATSSNGSRSRERKASISSNMSRRRTMPPEHATPLNQSDIASMPRSASRSSIASVRSTRGDLNQRGGIRQRPVPSSLAFHKNSNPSDNAVSGDLKASAVAAESIPTSPPPASIFQRDPGDKAASLTLKLVSDAQSGTNYITTTPTSPTNTRQLPNKIFKSASERHPPYDHRSGARDDLQRIIARNTAKTTTRQRNASVSSTASGKTGNNGNMWLPSTIKDRTAGAVLPTHATQSTSPPDASLGPVELDTIVPHAVQPPTLLQSWGEHYPADYLTDRFGFIYDKRQRSNSMRSIAIGGNQKENTADGKMTKPSSPEPGARLSGIDRNSDNSPSSASGSSRAASPGSKSSPPTEANKLISSSFMERMTRPSASTIVPPSAITISEAPLALRSKSGGLTAEESTVRLLLGQLSDMHDSLQRDRSVKWNEFLKKVRAERRRGDTEENGMPETLLADGELIGVSTLGNTGKGGKQKWKEFKRLVLGGIPVSYRWKVWTECSGASTMKIPGYYEELLVAGDDDPLIMSQIEMDIGRTLTDNIFFRKGPGVHKLKQVLVAYARRNVAVGYCQGMNMIAASLLLIMPTEEDAFWVLASIVENILPKTYFEQSLLASRADQTVLKQYVKEVLPNLDAHLQKLGVELEALTFQWFLSVFTDCLAAEALYRVWDVLLCIDGSTFLFQTALALLKLNETALLDCSTAVAVYSYLNSNMTHQGISIDGLIQASDALRGQVKRSEVERRREIAINNELALTATDNTRSPSAETEHREADQSVETRPGKRRDRSTSSQGSNSNTRPIESNDTDSTSSTSGDAGLGEQETATNTNSPDGVSEGTTDPPSPPWVPWM